MSTNPQPAPDEQQFAEVGAFEAELFWHKHHKTVIGAGVAIVVIVLGTVVYLISSQNSKEAAEAQLANAKTADAYRALIADYPRSRPAVDASFLLAESLREAGKIEDSSAVYHKIVDDYPESTLVGGARLGLAENFEMQNKLDDALAALRQVQTTDSDSYAAQVAMLLEGRILIRQGKMEEARRTLTGLVSAYPKSPAAQLAGAQLQGLATSITEGGAR